MKYFTEKYYELLKIIKDSNNNFQNNCIKTFRENNNETVYQSIAIEIVEETHCQLSCQWCYINQMDRKKIRKMLTYETFKAIINKINDYNQKHSIKLFSNIVFIGGEPTLNPELSSMIEYSLDNNMCPIVVTNGLKLNDMQYAKSICKENVIVTTHLPLYGYDDSILDNSCKCPGYSSKLKQAILNMLELKKQVINLEIIGELVLNDLTIDYAFESYTYCRNNNIEPFFEFMRISNDHYSNKALILSMDKLKSFVTNIYEYDVNNGYIDKSDTLSKLRYYLPPAINKPCTQIQNSIHVKFTENKFGDIISCCGQNIIHGNIMKDSLENIFEHKENTLIFSHQKDHIKGPCSICELYDIVGCEGGCRGNSLNIYNCAEASDPQCIFIKDEVKNSKELMCQERSLL